MNQDPNQFAVGQVDKHISGDHPNVRAACWKGKAVVHPSLWLPLASYICVWHDLKIFLNTCAYMFVHASAFRLQYIHETVAADANENTNERGTLLPLQAAHTGLVVGGCGSERNGVASKTKTLTCIHVVNDKKQICGAEGW